MTIAQYISEISKHGESPREIVGQLLDTTVQILELEAEHYLGKKPASNSLGDFQELFSLSKQDELCHRLQDIRDFRRKINILSPTKKETQELTRLVLNLVSISKFSSTERKLRIRYEPKLFNSTGIDTKHGFSRFWEGR